MALTLAKGLRFHGERDPAGEIAGVSLLSRLLLTRFLRSVTRAGNLLWARGRKGVVKLDDSLVFLLPALLFLYLLLWPGGLSLR